ncbi:MAG: nuclear transport factor 2 family protein [Ilumatobacteraceae bacterium]
MTDNTYSGPDDIAVVEAIYAAIAASELSTLFDLLDPTIVVVQDDRLPWGGRHVGHDGFATFGLALQAIIASSVSTDAVFNAGSDVVQMGHTRGTVVATGVPFDIAEVHRWTIRGSRAVTAEFSIDTPAMLRALAQG